MTDRAAAKDSESIEVRKAVQGAVLDICSREEEDEEEGDEEGGEKGGVMTAAAIRALAELTYLYATSSVAHDLDAFAKHANRRTITADDVKLVVRKHPGMLQKMAEFCDHQRDSRDSVRRVSESGRKKGNKNPCHLESSDDSDLENEEEFEDAIIAPNSAKKIKAKDSTSSDGSMDYSEEENGPAKKKPQPVIELYESSSSEDSVVMDNKQTESEGWNIPRADLSSSSSDENSF